MRKTYAYNSIIIGFLVALYVYVSTESLVLGIVTLLGVSIVGFIAIRAIERLIGKGVDKAVDAASNAMQNRKNKQ